MSVPKQPRYEAVPSTTEYDTEADELSVTEQYVVDSNSNGERHGKAATVALPPPQPLSISWVHRCARLVLDLVVALLALLFTYFGLMVRVYDRSLAEHGSVGYQLFQISQYGPTFFPVLFAAIASTSLKSIATWHVQGSKGASIGFLEQCLGSQTISRAFTTQINLRAFNLLAVVIVVIWCISPLGSQASLRVIFIAPTYLGKEITLTALKTFPPSLYSMYDGVTSTFTPISSSLIASIMATRLLDTRNQDIWGNLRFPAIEFFETMGGTDWIDIQNGQNVTYPSLAGMPVGDLPSLGNTSFTLSGSYLSVSCPIFGPTDQYRNFTKDLPSKLKSPSDDPMCAYQVAEIAMNAQLAISNRCYAATVPQGQSLEARRLLWISFSKTSGGYSKSTRAECILTTTYVDTNMTCTGSQFGEASGSTCNPFAVRRTPDPPADRNITVFDEEDLYADVGLLGLMTMLETVFTELDGKENPLLVYFTNPYNAIGSGVTGPIHEVTDRATFELRMAQLLNTIAYISVNSTAVTGNFDATERGLGTLFNITGFTIEEREVIRCNVVWLWLLTFASLFAFVFAVAGAVLRLFTLTPDMLGSTAIAFLDHRLGEVKGSSTWSSDEWVRYHRNAKIRFGDVEPEAEVGRIALAAVKGEAVRSVEKRRYYA
ncbi:hypothetical protein BU24DRAFT_370642 [Aaosphaeria arxii CBS 175.79]|uniref:Uncharacterized protein n=1 Tax=Aaosphaeria arxii CBS 175.79 TaxID=1450172 RepID=A0A6A5XUX4_9PLEO|nr:uncharacterized protein BU24DRAFT_370642 [Aaosphaeria arxii CBS 175.79]KAF2016726.1 hypothetical protein BU24DRAFT_370642 [Aaosphaeria arxii CBS 175.79]